MSVVETQFLTFILKFCIPFFGSASPMDDLQHFE